MLSARNDPIFSAHHEYSDRRLIHDANFCVLRPVIEPRQPQVIDVQSGVRSEVEITGELVVDVGRAVNPRADNQLLAPARF